MSDLAPIRRPNNGSPGQWLLTALILISSPARAENYFYLHDAEGTLHVSRIPLSSAYRALYPLKFKILVADAGERQRWRERLRQAVRDAAKQVGVDAALLDAVILVESGYDPQATSSKGAVGLMQLMPGTAADLGVQDRRDPEQNLLGGARYLADLLEEFDNDLELALAAYNAGPGAVRRAGGIPNYPETIQYVRTIKSIYGRAGQ